MPVSKSKNLAVYTLSQGFHLLSPLVSLFVFTRYVAPDKYGVLDMCQAISAIAVVAGNWGLHQALERYYFEYAESKIRQRRLLGTLMLFSALCLLIGFLTIFLLQDVIVRFAGLDQNWRNLLLLAIGVTFFNHLNWFCFLFFRNEENAVFYAITDCTKVVITAGLGIYLVVFLKMGIWGIAASQLIAQALALLVFLLKIGMRPFAGIDFPMLKESLKFGWPLMTKASLGVLGSSVDKLLIGAIISLGTLGTYSRAQMIGYYFFVFMTTIQNVYAPKWNHVLFKTGKAGDSSLSVLFTEYACICLLPAFCFVIGSQEFFGIFLPETYAATIPLVSIFVFFYALQSFGKLAGAVGSYLKRTKFIALVTVISYPISIGLNVLLIPRFGPYGAITVLFCVGMGTQAVYMYTFGRSRPVGYAVMPLLGMYGALGLATIITFSSTRGFIEYEWGIALRFVLTIFFLGVWLRTVGVSRLRTILAVIRNRISIPGNKGM